MSRGGGIRIIRIAKMKKNIIVIILFLLAIVLAVSLLILPGLDALNASRESIAFEKDRLARVQAQRQKLDALDKKYRDNPNELEKLIAALPKGAEFADLLVNLEYMAAASNLVMSSVDFKVVEKKTVARPPQMREDSGDILPAEKEPGSAGLSAENQRSVSPYKILAIILSLEGGYDNFKNYLKTIEGNERLMDVTRLNYGAKGGQQAQTYSFGLELNVYYQ